MPFDGVENRSSQNLVAGEWLREVQRLLHLYQDHIKESYIFVVVPQRR